MGGETANQNPTQAIEELKALTKSHGDRLKKFESLGEPDFAQNLRTRYQENGNWARHYSTVRMSITTFLVPVSLAILSFKWTPPAHPTITFVVLSGIVWMATLLLFLVFTRLTYGEMEKARVKRNFLPGAIDEAKETTPFHPRSDAASWILALVTIFYGALLFRLGDIRLWHFSLPPPWNLFPTALKCAIPGTVALAGLGALLYTIRQSAVSSSRGPATGDPAN